MLGAHRGHFWRFRQRNKTCQSLVSKRDYLQHGISKREHGKQTQTHSLGGFFLTELCSEAAARWYLGGSDQIQRFLAGRNAEEKWLHLGRH